MPQIDSNAVNVLRQLKTLKKRVFVAIALAHLTACDSQSIENTVQNSNCCETRAIDFDIATISQSAAPLHPETPFELQVKTQGSWQVDKAQLDSITMYMGHIPVFFKQTDNATWQAQVMVGACSEPTMLWHLQLQLVNNATSETQTVTYPVEVTLP